METMRPIHCLLSIAIMGPVMLIAAPTPPAARVQAWVEGDRLKVSRRVMFRTGELQVTPESKPVLDAMAATLKGLPEDRIVVIEGHSDAGGDETENLLLSRARAEYVVTALIRRGLSPAMLRAEGLGSARPLVPADHPEQYRNRRIEVYILPLEAQHLAPAPSPPMAARVPLLEETSGAQAAPVIPLLDDDDNGNPVRLALRPRVPLIDDASAGDTDLLPLRLERSTAVTPRIPLLGDDTMHIGFVDWK